MYSCKSEVIGKNFKKAKKKYSKYSNAEVLNKNPQIEIGDPRS